MLVRANISGMAKSGPTQISDEIWDIALPLLKQALAKKKTTQKALAAAVGVSGPSVNAWFNSGHRPTVTNLELALVAIGEDPDEVFGWTAGWERSARRMGYDPNHHRVREVYGRQFKIAMEYAAKALSGEQLDPTVETGEIRTG